MLLVACNTVSAVGLEAIEQAYPSMPVFNVITPAVEVAARVSSHHRVGVMGTRALVASGIYQRLLAVHGRYQVTAQAAPLLVPLVEEGWLDKPETKRIVKHYLTPFKQAQVDTLVLACTHYPLLKPLIASRISRRVRVVDPAEATAIALEKWLTQNPETASTLSKGESRLYVTDLTPHTETIARSWLKRTITLERVSLD
ncbi:MAG: aspartate/glutamate racemase family protein [Candidatus Veblenbacteria bacterium]|nr:aspartate/glutamate racemase family protein [Candidatus Veblenbacteria bacterium]